jgi:Fic family protein
MSRYETRTWQADPTVPGARSERQSFRYRAFVPDPIADLQPTLSALAAARVSEAERLVDALNRDPPSLASLEVLARRLLRAESVASSRIEGLSLSQRRLAKSEVEGAEPDETARSILGNVAAMEEAVSLGARTSPVLTEDILAIHRLLMNATATPEFAGELRRAQNWIGGNNYNPARADFVPPPPELVVPLMEDLCRFINRVDLPPAVQAAIAHAQFETIHPFADGNGRVGRTLIHVVLRRRGLAARYVPPVSLVLAAYAKAYVQGLTDYRAGRVDDWCGRFASGLRRAAEVAAELAVRLSALQDSWRARAGHPRSHSSAEHLIRKLPAFPIVTVATASKLLGRSEEAARQAVTQLAEAGVLHQTTVGRKNRAWEAPALFDLVNAVERELATPSDGDKSGRPAPGKPTA